MLLHIDPLTTNCRPLLMLLHELGREIPLRNVSLMAGDTLLPQFLRLNPNGQVPVLEDGGFVLTESGAIMRYLAAGTPFVPTEPRLAARHDEASDWFRTGFAQDYCSGYVYPLLFPPLAYPDPAIQRELCRRALARSERRLAVLDTHMLGDRRPFVCGEHIAYADLAGAVMISLGLPLGVDLSPYRNVSSWLERVTSRPSWEAGSAAFNAFVQENASVQSA